MHSGRRRQPGLGIMLLFYQMFWGIGIDRIPPVTLSVIGLQVAIFLRLMKLPWYKASEICISAYRVWRKKEFMRLIYGAFEHADDMHLYYNMISFALKGQSLERRFGSMKFLYIVSIFTVLTNVVLVALNLIASNYNYHFEDQCAIGFSGVIFALKVLTTYYNNNYTHHVMGIPIMIPAKYAVWLELLLIQLLVPNVSFFGHLAGILVGMAYVKGPLKWSMDALYLLIKSLFFSSPRRPRFEPRSEPTGYRSQFSEFVPPGMSEEEQLQQAMAASLNDNQSNYNHVPPYPAFDYSNPPPPGFQVPNAPSNNYESPPPPPPGFIPDLEELRNRRQTYFTYQTS